MDSILVSVKKACGIEGDCDDFDIDIIMAINTAFSILTQIGAGPKNGFLITDESSVWSDFLEDAKNLEIVKSYVIGKVRLIFDPPISSSGVDALTGLVKEFEWRINILVEERKMSNGSSDNTNS